MLMKHTIVASLYTSFAIDATTREYEEKESVWLWGFVGSLLGFTSPMRSSPVKSDQIVVNTTEPDVTRKDMMESVCMLLWKPGGFF